MTPALHRILASFVGSLAFRTEIVELPHGHFDIAVHAYPWADVAEVRRLTCLALFACAPDVQTRVRAIRMTWGEAIARAFLVAMVVALLLVAVWGSRC